MTDIRGYTLAQFDVFSRAARRQRLEQLQDQALNLRAAQYGKQDFMKHLQQLDKMAKLVDRGGG